MACCYKKVVGAAVLVGATTLITAQVVSQQYEQDQAEMMKKWMEVAQPSEEHAEMAKFAGKWHQKNSHWEYPGAEANVSEGTAEFKPILGGRFMIEKVTGEFEFNDEQFDFEGFGLFGFDRLTKTHTFVWVDNFGTMMMIGEGTADPTGKVITYMSEIPNPMGGGMVEFKTVSSTVDYDKQIIEMFGKGPDGEWFRKMKIESTRKEPYSGKTSKSKSSERKY